MGSERRRGLDIGAWALIAAAYPIPPSLAPAPQKGLPRNTRASGVAAACGKSLDVSGDAFLARVFDNEDDFKRMDFALSEVSSDARCAGLLLGRGR